MKLILLVLLAFLVTINANFIDRHCDCQAVSETFYVPYRSWEISSCKFCSCNDVAMTNCETACKAVVENYALTGCGKATKGSQVRYSFKASSCKSARSNDVYTCS